MYAAAGPAAAFLQGVDQISPRTLQRWINSHDDAGQNRQANREEKHRHGKIESRRGIERQKIGCHFRNDRNQLPG